MGVYGQRRGKASSEMEQLLMRPARRGHYVREGGFCIIQKSVAAEGGNGRGSPVHDVDLGQANKHHTLRICTRRSTSYLPYIPQLK